MFKRYKFLKELYTNKEIIEGMMEDYKKRVGTVKTKAVKKTTAKKS